MAQMNNKMVEALPQSTVRSAGLGNPTGENNMRRFSRIIAIGLQRALERERQEAQNLEQGSHDVVEAEAILA